MLGAKNPMRVMLMSTLIFEVIAVGLGIPVMILVSGVPATRAAALTAAVAVLALASAALLRSPAGYVLGWLTQLGAIGLGLLTPAMFVIGALFAALWLLGIVLGRRLEHNRPDTAAGAAPGR